MQYLKLFSLSFLLLSCSKENLSKKAGRKMQDFVVEISTYSKSINSNFAIIPQNGAELLFQFGKKSDEIDNRFISAIDGIGIEELYFNGDLAPDQYRIDLLKQVKDKIPVLVSDYISYDSYIQQSLDYNKNAGFVAFPRTIDNYDYKVIPETIYYSNENDIVKVSDAKNYLYLISNENFTSKQDFLDSIKSTNFDLIIIDAFFGEELFSKDDISSIKTKENGAKRMVISYLSIGSAEKYRYYWQEDWKIHKPRWLKKEYEGYPEEIWVKYWEKEWKDIIFGNDDSYMKKILDSGFDGAYLDNVEAFYFLYYND